MNPTFSVVIPVYNSAQTIEEVIQRTAQFFNLRNWDYELILVNDGSTDQSWEILCRHASENSRITAIDLAQNFGQQASIFCGLEKSKGDYVLTLDDDLQNPPEEMSLLVEEALKGHDLVFGRFRAKRHSLFRRFGSLVIRNLNKWMYAKPRDLAISNFRIFRRDLVDQMISCPLKYPYIQGLALKFSKQCSDVPVDHKDRREGKSHYRFHQFARTFYQIISTYLSFQFRSSKKSAPYAIKRIAGNFHDAACADSIRHCV